MRKVKLGLQKDVSRIFTGIAVPGKKSPDPSGVEQAKASTAGSQIPNHPVTQAHQAPPVAHTPLVQPPSAVAPSSKVITPPSASVTQSQQVVTPPPSAVTPSQQVVTPPSAPVVPQSGDPYTKSVVSAKPSD